MFERGVFVERYVGIIEIYPHKVTNSEVFNAALAEIGKDYNLVQIFPGWIRAFKKHEKGA
jgi:hypothetical protein